MTRRSWVVNPPDNVTAGEWMYLAARYDPREAAERRDRLVLALKRLVRAGKSADRIHQALLLGIDLWEKHEQQKIMRRYTQRWNRAVTQARKDVDRALASLRKLCPPGLAFDDDDLFAVRDRLFVLREPPTSPPVKRGRPWTWKQEADAALRRADVIEADRKELLSSLGFLEDEVRS